MVETRTVTLTNIVYDNRTTYLSVHGAGQLQQFAEFGSLNCYDASSAPKTYLVKVTADFDAVDEVLEKAKLVAEDELGLTIKTCKFLF